MHTTASETSLRATGDFESAAKYYDKSLQGNGGSFDYAALQVAKMKGYQRDYNGKLSALDVFMRDYATSPLIPDALLETTSRPGSVSGVMLMRLKHTRN